MLGIDDARLQLKILGTLTEEEQARLEEAVELNDTNVIGEILRSARHDNEEMDRKLEELSTSLSLVSVLDRNQLADRLNAWNRLGLPEGVEVEMTFDTVDWQRPVFGEQSTMEAAKARIATINVEQQQQMTTFDPEFKVFSGGAQHYELAGLRPWTMRSDQEEMKIQPDKGVDLLGRLASSLARLPSADFAVIGRASLIQNELSFHSAEYLLFATHPMREAETIPEARLAPYLTFYAFRDNLSEPIHQGTAVEVHTVISLLEIEAKEYHRLPDEVEAAHYMAAAERLRDWLRAQIRLGGAGLFEKQRYFLPIPVAFIAVKEDGRPATV